MLNKIAANYEWQGIITRAVAHSKEFWDNYDPNEPVEFVSI